VTPPSARWAWDSGGRAGPAARPAGRVSRRSDERGGATVVAVACLGVLLVVGSALGVVAAMVVAHRVAQAAADLSVLAGATDLAAGGDPCGRASAVALANGAQLTACSVAGDAVTVEVEVDGPRWLGQHHALGAQARAGPAP